MAYTTIDDPSAYFQTALYTGTNSSGNAITNSGNSDLQPDMVWIKVRTYDNPHTIQDTSRGFAGSGEVNLLQTASTADEATNGAFESFDSDGFTVGGTNPTSRAYNGSTDNYVAWQWKANGGTTSSNTNGTITSTVQANTDAGFSIGTFTGNGSSGATVGHGLGVKPDFIITKSRNNPSGAAMNWLVAHIGIDGMTGTEALIFNNINSGLVGSAYWGNAAPTSSVFTVGDNAAVNYTGNDMLFYAFAQKQGYSKFGMYHGNGEANDHGPFVYCGFKPAMVIIKYESSSAHWVILDDKRLGYNPINARLFPSQTNAESTSQNMIDIHSNGFQVLSTDLDYNTENGRYIYCAWAENPFVTSTGIPTTAT